MMRRFCEEDLDEVNDWYQAHGLKKIQKDLVPEYGLIEDGVGCGFLYLTDSSICHVDGYVTNPSASQEKRAKALYEMTEMLSYMARELGFKKLVAFTQDPNIMERALMHGFKDEGMHFMFVKEI